MPFQPNYARFCAYGATIKMLSNIHLNVAPSNVNLAVLVPKVLWNLGNLVFSLPPPEHTLSSEQHGVFQWKCNLNRKWSNNEAVLTVVLKSGVQKEKNVVM